MKNERTDILLQNALKSTETPDRVIIERVKNTYFEEEMRSMNKTHKWSIKLVFAAVLTVLFISSTVFAALYLLKPSEVAKKFDNMALSAAFDSDSAVNINKSITSGGYKFTLLATVAGRDLTDMAYYEDGEIQSDRLYTVIAIENEDGTPMTEDAYTLDFFASPLIKGVEPSPKNILGMHGGACCSVVVDGVLYRITECDNAGIFAEHGLYFAICSGVFYDYDAFLYNQQTGEITANDDFSGANVLFDLPIRKEFADNEKAAEFFRDLERAEPEPLPSNVEDEDVRLVQGGIFIPDSIEAAEDDAF